MVWCKFAFCLLCWSGGFQDETRPALIADMDRDIDAFYQRFRDARSPREKANAVFDLCQLHNQLWADPRYASIEKLRGMRNQLVFQLKTAQKELRKSFGMKPSSRTERAVGSLATGSAKEFVSFGDRLADDDLSDHLLQSLLVSCRAIPGPDQIALHAGSFGGGDNGPELIALIESTIHPEHWDINGGPGHIHYYRPVMALVVRASSIAHEDMSGLLQTLRDNGQ